MTRCLRSQHWFDILDHIYPAGLYHWAFVNYGLAPQDLQTKLSVIGAAR
jgi:hypothetical protein